MSYATQPQPKSTADQVVYVLTWNTAHEGGDVWGVYSTLDGAKAAAGEPDDWYVAWNNTHWLRRHDEGCQYHTIEPWAIDRSYPDPQPSAADPEQAP